MSKPISEKKSVKVLLDLCQAYDIDSVVISPGSRNAPLIISFTAEPFFNCYSIVDERSAAFFALGMAQQTGKPVALVCTSGTALLNYAPAVAEAFYQGIPLVIISADRPAEWIDQGDGQTIVQHNIFANFIKYSCTLPIELSTEDDEWYTKRLISEALIKTNRPLKGPVHINAPFRKPLYGRTVHSNKSYSGIEKVVASKCLDDSVLMALADGWRHTERVLILLGMQQPNEELVAVLGDLASRDRLVVLTETLSNAYHPNFIRCIDRVVASFSDGEGSLFRPDLLITLDGPVVSKMIKTLIRKYPPKEHWHISESGSVTDTFKQLTRVIGTDPAYLMGELAKRVEPAKSRYRETWQKRQVLVEGVHQTYLKKIGWSDLNAFESILEKLPRPCNLQLGNSTPVRYAQLFDCFESINSYSNRGTSGIDGCMSTALGASRVGENQTVLIIGDLSFFYDSNALWSKKYAGNFKIILINNGGGGIFRFLPGSGESEELDTFFAASHGMTAEHICQQFGVNYVQVDNKESLDAKLSEFFGSSELSVLEILTPEKESARVLKEYFSQLKNCH